MRSLIQSVCRVIHCSRIFVLGMYERTNERTNSHLVTAIEAQTECGLLASFEKFIIDCEVLQQIIYAQRPIQVDETTLAVDAIAEVGPHGHFFGCDHTQQSYRDAFYTPLPSDWRNYETWLDDRGSGRINAPPPNIRQC